MKRSRILITGAWGLVGKAIAKALFNSNLPITRLYIPSREDVDFSNQHDTDKYFEENIPDIVIACAALAGGIVANTKAPGDFIITNLLIQANTLEAANNNNTKRFIFIGSNCIYPKHAEQPIKEEALFTGPFEPTIAPYGMAKAIGVEAARAYRKQYGLLTTTVVAPNLYGPGDKYDLETSHVVPALIRKVYESTHVTKDSPVIIWGTGNARRELLHVDDLASAVLYMLTLDNPPEIVNAGYGSDISIIGLTMQLIDIAGHTGQFSFDATKPDGVSGKLLDSSKLLALGWKPNISLYDGLKATYESYKQYREQL